MGNKIPGGAPVRGYSSHYSQFLRSFRRNSVLFTKLFGKARFKNLEISLKVAMDLAHKNRLTFVTSRSLL